MSHESPLGRWLTRHRTDETLAKVGLVASVLLSGLQLFASQVFLAAIPFATGVACVVYLGLRTGRETAVGLPTLPASVGGFLPAVVYGGLAGVVLLTGTAGARTVPVYLLTGAVGSAILAQVLLLEDAQFSPGSVLVQLVVAAVVVRLSALFVTPGYVGVDVWTHVPTYVAGIAETGSLSPLAGSKYSMAPLYHAYGAVAAGVFGSPRLGVYLTLGLVLPLSVVLVYATGTLFVAPRWAALAAGLYAFSDQFVRWGIHVIPTSLGLVFFLVLAYLVTRAFSTGADRWITVGLVVFSLATVFTHQVSTAVMLVFLGIAAFVAVAVRLSGGPGSRGSTGRTAAVLVGVFLVDLGLTLSSWSVTPWSGGRPFLWQMVRTAREGVLQQAGFLNLASEGTGAVAAETGPQSALAPFVPYVDVAGFTLLLTAAVVGGLRMLRWQRRADVSIAYVLAGTAMFVAVFGFSLFGIRVFLPGRWMAFLYLPLVVMAAVGVSGIARHGSGRVVLATVVVLALVFPTSMVVAEKATLDSPAFEDHHARFSYTEAELAAVGTISRIHGPAIERDLNTDHPYRTLFRRTGGYRADTLVLGADGVVSDAPVVYREYQSTGPATLNRPEGVPGEDVSRNVAPSAVCRPTWNEVYANDAVRFCTPSRIGEASP